MIALGLGLGGDPRGGLRREGGAADGVAPALVAAPRLAGLVDGAARIGAPLGLDPGAWRGIPVPALTVAWRRDGVAVAGATGAVFLPRPEDDGCRLEAEVVAGNRFGQARAVTAAVRVAWPAPTAAGRLPEQNFPHKSGTKTVTTAFDFSGGGLSFRVEGDGVSIDPVTGTLTITTEDLKDGVEVVVTATNSGGSVASRFRLTITALPVTEAPRAVTPPSLVGDGRIGSPVTLDPGVWAGTPVPSLAIEWRRDGVAIPGATGGSYVPGDADDLSDLSVRVTASNASGSAVAETAALAILQAAPAVAAEIAPHILRQGNPAGQVAAAAAFTGQALTFAVIGGGAVIDPATGLVSLPTGSLRADTVTVTASNSGGSASTGFAVTVAPAVLAPTITGSIGDCALVTGQGPATVSAQAVFAGAELAYALVAPPAGVSIDPASGRVTIDTGAPLAATTITVEAANAAGSARASFGLVVRAAATAFDSAARLGELGFLGTSAAQVALSAQAEGFARLVVPASGRVHGRWATAVGDGRLRALVRWGAPNPAGAPYSPFLLAARLKFDGSNWQGVSAEILQPATGSRKLRVLAFTGSGSTTTVRGTIDAAWAWDSWYWVEFETEGAALRARFYPEASTAPDWQIVTTTTVLAPGAAGPTGLPQGGQSPVIDIRRLEFQPLAVAAPAAAAADWGLDQLNLPL